MTLLLDGIVFSLQRQGGISVYFRELLQRLQRDAVPTLLTLEGRLEQSAPAATRTLARDARPLERYRDCRVPVAAGATVFHSSYYRRPSRRLPSVVTVHDFIYERFVHGPRRWVHSAQKIAAIRDAQVVVCVSHSTLDDLHRMVGLRTGQRAQVILNGVSEAFRPLAPELADLRTFEVLTRALKERRVLRFSYRNLGARKASQRRVRPYHLACIDSHW